MTFRDHDYGLKEDDAEDKETDWLIQRSGIYENSDG